jgi:hypothetical protein
MNECIVFSDVFDVFVACNYLVLLQLLPLLQVATLTPLLVHQQPELLLQLQHGGW